MKSVNKPGDHPEFFRFPAPEGRSRESTIRLDGEGRFWHENNLVEHPGLAAGMHTWIRRHPDDGRFILSNGYDWTYLTVDDAPFVVQSIRRHGREVQLTLNDGTEERWDPRASRIGEGGALYASVKAAVEGGPFEAKFSRFAQTLLAPLLVERDGAPAVRLSDADAEDAEDPKATGAADRDSDVIPIGPAPAGAIPAVPSGAIEGRNGPKSGL